jgi:hypothetical protein
MDDGYRDLDTRLRAVETREAARDVKVEVATEALNRLSVLVGGAGLAILGSVIAFLLAGGN